MTKFEPRINVSQWVQLPTETRRRIAELFKLEATGWAFVENGKLKHDRHTEKDLLGISIEKMRELTGSTETSFFPLFDKVLEYIENERNGVVQKTAEERAKAEAAAQDVAVKTAVQTISQISEALQPVLKKRGRPAKKV